MASNQSSDDYQTLKNKGNDMFRAKDFERALQYYSEAIEVKEDEAVTYSNRAQCWINLKNYFNAKEDCDKAIELDPTFTKAYYRRAIAFKGLSRFRLALDDFKKVVVLDPNFTQAESDIKSIENLVDPKQNPRLELTAVEKPSALRSVAPIKTFQLRNKYDGKLSYS